MNDAVTKVAWQDGYRLGYADAVRDSDAGRKPRAVSAPDICDPTGVQPLGFPWSTSGPAGSTTTFKYDDPDGPTGPPPAPFAPEVPGTAHDIYGAVVPDGVAAAAVFFDAREAQAKVNAALDGEPLMKCGRCTNTDYHTHPSVECGGVPLTPYGEHQLESLSRRVQSIDDWSHRAVSRIMDLEYRIDRIVAHVNREVGVAETIPLHERVESSEWFIGVDRFIGRADKELDEHRRELDRIVHGAPKKAG
jgi:hypothetical protein